jgi:hypothetical protein
MAGGVISTGDGPIPHGSPSGSRPVTDSGDLVRCVGAALVVGKQDSGSGIDTRAAGRRKPPISSAGSSQSTISQSCTCSGVRRPLPSAEDDALMPVGGTANTPTGLRDLAGVAGWKRNGHRLMIIVCDDS